MSDTTASPTPPTCDRCGATFDRDTAVAYLQDRRVVHGRADECVEVFRARVAALEQRIFSSSVDIVKAAASWPPGWEEARNAVVRLSLIINELEAKNGALRDRVTELERELAARGSHFLSSNEVWTR